MIPTDNTIFLTLSDLLKQAVIIFEQRISEIENISPSPASSEADKEADAGIRVFQVQSLKVVRDTISFISDEIIREDPKYYLFLLPNTRKLFDVYIRFLHLLENCSTVNKRALTCIAYQLMSYRSLNNQSVYDGVITNNKNLLVQENFEFPVFQDFDYIWYQRKSGLAFSSTRDLFKEVIINKYSNPPIKIFKGQNIVQLYGNVSELCHGNPYFYYDGSYNERFWVATLSFMVATYLIDLIDSHILNKPFRKDFRVWVAEVDKASRAMILLWKPKI